MRFGVVDRERQAGDVRAEVEMGEVAAGFRGDGSFTQALYGRLIL